MIDPAKLAAATHKVADATLTLCKTQPSDQLNMANAMLRDVADLFDSHLQQYSVQAAPEPESELEALRREVAQLKARDVSTDDQPAPVDDEGVYAGEAPTKNPAKAAREQIIATELEGADLRATDPVDPDAG